MDLYEAFGLEDPESLAKGGPRDADLYRQLGFRRELVPFFDLVANDASTELSRDHLGPLRRCERLGQPRQHVTPRRPVDFGSGFFPSLVAFIRRILSPQT
jgi:hypothetical protein